MIQKDTSTYKSVEIIVLGLVQGVGFRPFVYRMATKSHLTGWVQNTNENVRIQVTGLSVNIDGFIVSLKQHAPQAACIEEVLVSDIETTLFPSFTILGSHDVSDEITEISPDIAVCDDCLCDINEPGNRLDYSFVNCTNCGPRFTIIKDLPYDRGRTTMNLFPMCPDCHSEYESILDRRFHAQPTACNDCGPQYEMFVENQRVSNSIQEIIIQVAQRIDNGYPVMIKGMGGMHLACDAFNESAVKRLRSIKSREGKPFAVMFRNMDELKELAFVNADEELSLDSWRRPISLLKMKQSKTENVLAASINANLNLIGVMLPYMPFHYQLFSKLKTPAIVLTSGNFSNEPILIENQDALDQFSAHVDAIVLHNRDIYNRTDDSVVRLMAGKERVFRRSRGYVPAPVRTSLNTEGIVAFGAELTNCFCVGKGHKAFLSQYIGDLQGIETTEFYENSLVRFLQLFRVNPSLLAVDMHPAYISTRVGLGFSGVPLVQVQHHHAHIASCMVENHIDEKVIGVAFDGTGFGTDGNTWGSEFLLCDLSDFKRITHFDYIPMPGGDQAAEEPWRIAVSYLYKIYGSNFTALQLPLSQKIDKNKVRMLVRMIDRKINCPLTSGAGRLFDCVASLLDLVQVATFQAEGPLRLESIIRENITENYRYTISETICFDETIRGIVDDILNRIDSPTIATKFHNTIISVIFETVNRIRQKEDNNQVVLSGGVFQNKYLFEGTIDILQKNNFKVYSHATVPTNDGGIALGQLAVASRRRELKCV